MDIGVMVGGSGLAPVVTAVREVANAGVRRAWLPQVFSGEALTAIAVAGREIPDIEFGTAVIPTYPRHPAPSICGNTSWPCDRRSTARLST